MPLPARLAVAAAALAVVLHLAVLASWRLSLLPAYAEARHAERLDTPTVERFPEPAPGWPWLETGAVRIRAPFGGPPDGRDCGDGCRLPIGLRGGVLSVGSATAPDGYRETLLLLAPDRADVSFWAPPWRNWQTIHALGMRVGVASHPPETFRFEQGRARGIVSRHADHGIERFVVYAFGPDGTRAPVLATSRVSRTTLLGMLGSLRVAPPAVGASAAP